MNAFQSIPPKVRTSLYLLYAVVGLVLGGCQVIDVSELWGFPVIKALALLAYVGTALGFTAAANVSSAHAATVVAPADVEVREVTPDEADADHLGD